jgi:hypothetical protein
MKTSLAIGWLLAVWFVGVGLGQEDSGPVQGKTGTTLLQPSATNPGPINTNWKLNKLVTSAMSHSVVMSPTGAMPGGTIASSALVSQLRKQSLAAQSLLVPAVRPVSNNSSGPLLSGGTATMLNSPQKSGNNSSPQIAPSQIMKSPGSGSGVSKARGVPPTMQQAPGAVAQGHPQQPQRPGSQVIPTQVCIPGIAIVDGQKSGVSVSPVSGPEGQFVIQGCGFGSIPGEVYLSGVQYDPARAKVIVQHLGLSSSPDRVNFTIPPNQWKGNQQFTTFWSDRLITAQIDPNASGLYDTNSVTLNIKTANGHVYQVAGMNFVAARADQVLSWIVPPQSGHSSFVMNTAFVTDPTAVVHLAAVTDSSGNLILPTISSPSTGTTWSAESVGAIRAKLGQSTPSRVTFQGGTDDYQLHLAPGFQLDPQTGIQMRHTQIDVNQCQQSFNGDYLSTGNWAVSYTSKTAFQISWQEQSCWPKPGTQGLSPMDYGSVSVYALQITVLGPRGVSPWASGSLNPLTVKQGTNHPLLLGH